MSDNQTKLVVLICEEALEPIVLPEFLAAGAKGYTVCDARGCGTRGVRDARWLSANVRIEALCREPVARRIMEMIETRYSDNYGLVIYTVDATVIRGDKF
ncbi:MAG: transcriptional regulator [Rhizobacter sp.]|nr:transcriptional regulator [Rhizobacter sp.]